MRKHDEEILRGINRLSWEMVPQVVFGRTLIVLGYTFLLSGMAIILMGAVGILTPESATIAVLLLYVTALAMSLRRLLPGSTRIPTISFNERASTIGLIVASVCGLVLFQELPTVNLASQGVMALYLLTYVVVSQALGKRPGLLLIGGFSLVAAIFAATLLQRML